MCNRTGQNGVLYYDPDGCPWVHSCQCTQCIHTQTSCVASCQTQGKLHVPQEPYSNGCENCLCACPLFSTENCTTHCTSLGKEVSTGTTNSYGCDTCECHGDEDTSDSLNITTCKCIIIGYSLSQPRYELHVLHGMF